MSIRLFLPVLLVAAVALAGCSRYQTRTGTAPILVPQEPLPPSPIEMEIAPPAETATPAQGVVLPPGTALPARRNY